MSLEEKVQAIESVFEELDQSISRFQSWSTLHCQFGCGKCCYKSDIEATALEFLPFALFLYKENLAMDWFEKLRESRDHICLILNPTQPGAGLCSQYRHRGLICRLFGYSARMNKHGERELITCQIIKTEQESAYLEAIRSLEEKEVPVMSHYYMQLHAIDPDLARDFYPINTAIRKAIEIVLQYYAYRN